MRDSRLAYSLSALLSPHPPALRKEEGEKVGGQDPQSLLYSLPSSIHKQNLQTSGLKQMTSLWFPALTTLQVHRLLRWGRTLVPGVFPHTCRFGLPYHPAGLEPGPDSSATRRDGLVCTNNYKQPNDMGPIVASLMMKKSRQKEEKWLIQDYTAMKGAELRFKILSALPQRCIYHSRSPKRERPP